MLVGMATPLEPRAGEVFGEKKYISGDREKETLTICYSLQRFLLQGRKSQPESRVTSPRTRLLSPFLSKNVDYIILHFLI